MTDAEQPGPRDVRAAAEAVKAAVDRHLEAVERRAAAPAGGTERSEADLAVHAAFDALAVAGDTYDALLYARYDEVTPFEIPGEDTLPDYTGPEHPRTLSLYMRRDYAIREPKRLIAQAQRVTDLDPDSVDQRGGGTARSGLHPALAVVFGEYEPDDIGGRPEEFGLEEGDSTLWVAAGHGPQQPGEWLAAPFDQADPARIICRFDVSAAFDDDDLDEDLDED